jgi:hypothetical protein
MYHGDSSNHTPVLSKSHPALHSDPYLPITSSDLPQPALTMYSLDSAVSSMSFWMLSSDI